MSTDILSQKTQLSTFEDAIAAKADIFLQKDSLSIECIPDYIPHDSKTSECFHSLEEKLGNVNQCENCPNSESCFPVEEVCVWPFSELDTNTHISLLNQAYNRLSNAVAKIDISAGDDAANTLENYQNDFAFLSALINVLSLKDGRDITYDKYKEIVGANPRWIPHNSKVDSTSLSPLQSYAFHANHSVAVWNDKDQYKKYISWMLKQEDSISVYTCNNLFEICFSILDYYVLKGIHIKRCKICKKFFIPEKDYKQVYCSDSCSNEFEKKRVEFARKSSCYREYEKIRDMLRKRRDRLLLNQSSNEIYEAENEAIRLWENIKIQRVDGMITEDEAIARLRDFRENLKKQK